MLLQTYQPYKSLDIKYVGPNLDSEATANVIYFSLCAQESLMLDPYNQPARVLAEENVRVFSITLPGHGNGYDKYQAMNYWADHLNELVDFIEDCKAFVQHLHQHHAQTRSIGVMGLSRGGLIASQLATLCEVSAIVGFAPVTDLAALKEFQNCNLPKNLLPSTIIPNLANKKLRYYIGNRDVRVYTKSAFDFVSDIANYAHEQRIRPSCAELFITPSTGLQGHGTLFEIFKQGAIWLKSQIM